MNTAINPIDAVNDITVMCLKRLPSRNTARSAMRHSYAGNSSAAKTKNPMNGHSCFVNQSNEGFVCNNGITSAISGPLA